MILGISYFILLTKELPHLAPIVGLALVLGISFSIIETDLNIFRIYQAIATTTTTKYNNWVVTKS